MMNIMYDIPSLENLEKCIITAETVTEKAQPNFVFKEQITE